VLFSPAAVEEVVRSIPALGDEYELIVSKKGDSDDILLRVELRPGLASPEVEAVVEKLKQQLWLKTNLHLRLEVCPYGTLPRYEGKGKRFKDLRHAH